MDDFEDEFERDVRANMLENKELPYVIHKRKNSKNYWMRFSIKGFGQQRYGLGTDNLEEAHLIADEKYREATFKAKHEILEGKSSFNYLSDQYVAGLYAEAKEKSNVLTKARYAEAVCERYLKPYFKRRTISSIGTPKVNAYIEWRKIYWTTGDGKDEKVVPSKRNGKKFERPVQKVVPTISTLKRETSVLRGVFKHAVRLGFITTGQIPLIEFEKVPKTKRPYFTKEQYNIIQDAALERMLEVHGDPSKRRLLYDRRILRNFVHIAGRTGMRPKEIFQLNWEDLEGFDPSGKAVSKRSKLVIIGYGKGKRPHRSVPKPSVHGDFVDLWDAQCERFGETPKTSDPVFRNYNGKRVGSLKKSLNALLEACDLKKNRHGEVYSAYCFRHSYATWELQKSRDPHKLATNMRTSTKMIEEYYDHAIADDYAEEFREEGW